MLNNNMQERSFLIKFPTYRPILRHSCTAAAYRNTVLLSEVWRLFLFLWSSASDLDNEITSHANSQHRRQDVQLDISAQEVTVGKWYDKADRLPQAEVSKSCWYLLREQTPVQCYNNQLKTIIIMKSQLKLFVYYKSTHISKSKDKNINMLQH